MPPIAWVCICKYLVLAEICYRSGQEGSSLLPQDTNMIDGLMTTNFALSLSFDGIRLLQRVADGWHFVGETELDVPDLPAALAKMRETALSLDPSGLRTKLLIPDEQIKYLTLETARTDLDDVLNALSGATPYGIDELVVDFDRSGGRTYIAAVARETLEEAEAFALDHNFNPISFAAIANPLTFQTEVFFGPTQTAIKAGGTPIVRENTLFVVTGKVDLSDPAPEEEDDDAAALLFTPRPRMATPESVVPPSPTDALLPDPDAPKAPEDKLTPPAPLAVQTGNPTGPAVASVTQDLPAPKTAPVTTSPRAPTISPVIQPTPKPVTTVPVPQSDSGSGKPQADDMAAIGGFSTRRAAPAVDPRPQEPAKADKQAAAISSKQAQTRRKKPRYLGLILTAILLIVMALVALWASTLSEEDLATWFGIAPNGVVEVAQTEPPVPELDPPVTDDVAVAPEANVATASAADPLNETEAAAPLPQVRASNSPNVLSPAEADRIYAATGVWQRAPRFPFEPRTDALDLALTPPDDLPTSPAAALPEIAAMAPDLALLAPVNPPAPGTDFVRDAQGFVLATPEGARSPQGAIIYAGTPPIQPPLRPTPSAQALEQIETLNAPDGVNLIAGRPSKIPPLRPQNAALPTPAPAEATTLGGVNLAGIRPAVRPEDLTPEELADDAEVALAADTALAGARPKIRPAGLAPEPTPESPPTPDITAVVAAIAQAAPASPFVNATARAVQASRRPDPRPNNFSRVVARATDLATRQAARATPATPQAAPATPVTNNAAQPTGPTTTSVAQAATIEGAIKLRDINLIGVYGQPNNRRALVRLGNGRYVKVEIGSSLDGGSVTAIGDNALNYVKRGKTYALQLPSG